MRKLIVLAILSLMASMMFAPAALAAKPAQDPNCSFEMGKTTCVTTKETSYITTKVVGYGYAYCGPYLRFTPVTVNQKYQTDVTETTTTVYTGKSDKVESTETTSSEVGPYAVGGTYTQGC